MAGKKNPDHHWGEVIRVGVPALFGGKNRRNISNFCLLLIYDLLAFYVVVALPLNVTNRLNLTSIACFLSLPAIPFCSSFAVKSLRL